VDGLSPAGIKDLVEYLAPFCDEKGYSKIQFSYGQRLYDAGLNAEKLPEEKVHEFIEGRVKRNAISEPVGRPS
jgi:hypothetical protein